MTKTQRIAAILLPATCFATASRVGAAQSIAETEPANPPAPVESTASQPEPAGASQAPQNQPSAAPAPTVDSAPPRMPAPPPQSVPSAFPAPAAPPAHEGPITLFGSNAKIGGFGGLGTSYTRFAGKDAAQFCLEGALLIDHSLSLGAAGCGVSRTLRTTTLDPSADPDYRTTFGYGGAVLRYHFASYKYFNFAIGTLIGGGAIASADWEDSRHDRDSIDHHPDFVFVVEPHVAAYMNVTRWLRVGATGGYRFVTGVETKGLSESDLAAPTLGLQLQAGWF